MKAEDLKGKTQDELQKTLLDLKKQQFNLRIQKSQGQLENTAQIRTVRRDIARVRTFIGKLEEGSAAKAAPKKAEAKKAAPKKAAAKKTAKKDTSGKAA